MLFASKQTGSIVIMSIVLYGFCFSNDLFGQRSFTEIEDHMRIDDKRDFPKAIYNVKSRKYSGSPEEIARQYLKENKSLLKMEEDLTDLQFLELKKSPAGNHVGFRQVYKGIPVFRSETVVSINHENQISMVFNGHMPDIDINTVPVFSGEQALNLARQAVEVRMEKSDFKPTEELMIYEDSTGHYRLIWKIVIFALEPDGAWMTIVDAHTGQILEKFNTTQDYVNGNGNVFKPDPGTELRNAALKDSNDADYQLLQPAYKTVTLFDLNNAVGGLYRVRGRYAYSKDIEVPNDSVVNVTNPANFSYKRNQNGFEEVNIYYFIDNQRRYLGTLGFSPGWVFKRGQADSVRSESIRFDSRWGTIYRNAQYRPVEEYLRFGSPISYVDAGEDQSVILHEYSHALHDALTIGGTDSRNYDTDGVGEGIAEYMGIDNRRFQQSNPFRPNVRNNWFWPDIPDSISIKMPADAKYPTHWGPGSYDIMRVWASTLMDMEYTTATNPAGGTRFGRDVTIRLMLTSLSYLTSNATALDYVWAIFQADRDIPEYKGMHLNDLADIFDNRGFFYYNKASGNITANTTWSKPMLVTGDVTVNSGVILSIKPNSSRLKQSFVFFETTDDRSGGADASKCEIIVNGTFKADSTTFTGPSKGSWYGIRYMPSGSGGYLKKCTIKNAYIGVFVENKSPEIFMNFIDDAVFCGIYIKGSTAQPLITQNFIEADFACVAHNNGGNGYFANNSFRNSQYGVYVSSGSPSYDYYNVGRNKFETSVSLDKIRVNSGQPIFSTYQYFTIPSSSNMYIRNSTANTILARYDYWSAYPPSGTYFYGSVDRSNPLSSPPSNPPAGPTWSLPKASGEDFFLAFDNARMFFYNQKYSKARERFKELTEKYFSSEYSSYTLNWYMLATEQMEPIGTQAEYLNSVKNDKSAHRNTRFYALKWLLQCEMREGTIEKAKKLAAEVESGSVYDREISLDLAMGLFEYKGDKKAAEEVLGKLSEKFKDDNTFEAVGFIKRNFVKDVELNKPMVEKRETAEGSLLFGAFPNPSNASVRILYGLEHSGHVSVVIYNVIGQKVLTLLDKDMEVGKHDVVWDGKDTYGHVVSSGVYLCRFQAMGRIQTIKLLMTK